MEEPLVLPLLLLVIPAKAGIQLLLCPSLVIPAKAGIQLLLAQTEIAASKVAARRTARRANPAQQPMDGLRPCSQPWMARRGGGVGWRAVRRRSDESGVGEQHHAATQRRT